MDTRRVFVNDRRVQIAERQVLSTGSQTEIGVQVARRIDVVVHSLPRGKDDQILARIEFRLRQIGKRPFVEVVGVVAQMPTAEIDRRGRRIVDFDPVREVAVPVGKRRVIRRHELGDERRRRKDEPWLELLDSPRARIGFVDGGNHQGNSQGTCDAASARLGQDRLWWDFRIGRCIVDIAFPKDCLPSKFSLCFLSFPTLPDRSTVVMRFDRGVLTRSLHSPVAFTLREK